MDGGAAANHDPFALGNRRLPAPLDSLVEASSVSVSPWVWCWRVRPPLHKRRLGACKVPGNFSV